MSGAEWGMEWIIVDWMLMLKFFRILLKQNHFPGTSANPTLTMKKKIPYSPNIFTIWMNFDSCLYVTHLNLISERIIWLNLSPYCSSDKSPWSWSPVILMSFLARKTLWIFDGGSWSYYVACRCLLPSKTVIYR